MRLVEHRSIRDFMRAAASINARYAHIDGILCFIDGNDIHVVRCEVVRR